MGLQDHQDDGTGHFLSLDLDYLHVERRASSNAADSPLCTASSNSLRSGLDPAPPVCRAKMDFALKLGYSEALVLLVLGKLGPQASINDVLGELVKLGTESEREAVSPSPPPCSRGDGFRPVVVDGSNVAMSHGNKDVFSCQGIQLAVDWFVERGHRDITVFVPAWRKEQSRPDALITDQEVLRRLEKAKLLVFTPSRRVQGRRVVCYDDRFIVKLAYESDGVIVSNDNYRDLSNEKPEWRKFIEERLLMFSFVNDKFMPPDDPLGRHGPSLENFLRKEPLFAERRNPPCPYGKKCTYGHKCKFFHPERSGVPQRSVADELRAKNQSSRTLLAKTRTAFSDGPNVSATEGGSKSSESYRSESPESLVQAYSALKVQSPAASEERPGYYPHPSPWETQSFIRLYNPFVPEPPGLARYRVLRETLFANLCCIFPTNLVRLAMEKNPHVMDAQELAAAVLLEKLQRV